MERFISLKYQRKRFSTLVSITMTIILLSTYFHSISYGQTNQMAERLSKLGLLKNISEDELNLQLTRDVGIAMIIKSLGYTDVEASRMKDECTFTDMSSSEWSKGYVSIAYNLGITVGKVAGEIFDPKGLMTSKEFVVFQLRALGYDAKESWENASKLSEILGLTDRINDNYFTKSDAANIMYNALFAQLQNRDNTMSLLDQLIIEGIVDSNMAINLGLITADKEYITPLLEVEALIYKYEVDYNLAYNFERYNLLHVLGIGGEVEDACVVLGLITKNVPYDEMLINLELSTYIQIVENIINTGEASDTGDILYYIYNRYRTSINEFYQYIINHEET